LSLVFLVGVVETGIFSLPFINLVRFVLKLDLGVPLAIILMVNMLNEHAAFTYLSGQLDTIALTGAKVSSSIGFEHPRTIQLSKF
jgi:hypothetical protein